MYKPFNKKHAGKLRYATALANKVPKNPVRMDWENFKAGQLSPEGVDLSVTAKERAIQYIDKRLADPLVSLAERDALVLQKIQLESDAIEMEMLIDFTMWLKGQGKEEDHIIAQTAGLGYRVPITEPSVVEYCKLWTKARQDFLWDIIQIYTEGPTGVMQAWMYFKYVIRGKLDDQTTLGYLEDWALYNRFTSETSGAPQKAIDEVKNYKMGGGAPKNATHYPDFIQSELQMLIQREDSEKLTSPDHGKYDLDYDVERKKELFDRLRQVSPETYQRTVVAYERLLRVRGHKKSKQELRLLRNKHRYLEIMARKKRKKSGMQILQQRLKDLQTAHPTHPSIPALQRNIEEQEKGIEELEIDAEFDLTEKEEEDLFKNMDRLQQDMDMEAFFATTPGTPEYEEAKEKVRQYFPNGVINTPFEIANREVERINRVLAEPDVPASMRFQFQEELYEWQDKLQAAIEGVDVDVIKQNRTAEAEELRRQTLEHLYQDKRLEEIQERIDRNNIALQQWREQLEQRNAVRVADINIQNNELELRQKLARLRRILAGSGRQLDEGYIERVSEPFFRRHQELWDRRVEADVGARAEQAQQAVINKERELELLYRTANQVALDYNPFSGLEHLAEIGIKLEEFDEENEAVFNIKTEPPPPAPDFPQSDNDNERQ
jgi:hypothetical protein